MGRMYTADGGRGSTASEASRMLEAALEQMDGIIQGAKYDLPQFDNFSIQVRLKKGENFLIQNILNWSLLYLCFTTHVVVFLNKFK